MHELTVVENIIRITAQVAEENKINYITAVNLDAGCMQHLNEEILKHGFDAAKEGTLLDGAILRINRVSVKLQCNGCGHTFGPVDGKYFCPDCGDKDTNVVQGMELIITSIEGE
jgi:hydrogenase nickel incorporation protein HypA/HybF